MHDTYIHNVIISHCIEQLSSIDNESEWMQQILNLTNKLGIDKFLFSILTTKGLSLEKAIIKSNYNQEWRRIYDQKKYAYIDPTVSHCMRANTPYVWNESSFQTSEQKELFQGASNFNLDKGVIFPIHGPNGELGMCAFVMDSTEFGSRVELLMPYLTLVKEYIFTSAVKIFNNTSKQFLYLTPRESEVIKWTAAGKTCWEISVILGCSQSTIHFHMNNLREKFNVRSKHEILMFALTNHLVNL